jgi:phosphotransferase system IIB component
MTKFSSFTIILSLLGGSLSFASKTDNYSLTSFGYEAAASFENGAGAAVSLSAKEIWNNYIEALGGVKNLKKVKDRATIMESHIYGQNMIMTIYQKAPDKMKQIITTSSITQDICFDGKNGTMKIGGKKTDITGSELEKLKYESMINFVINIDSLGVKLISKGIEKVNGKDSYKIEVILPSGKIITQYFDVKTWLKVKQIENVTAAKKAYVQETYFDDYREVMGVKYPFAIKESLGTQSMDVKVTSVKINIGLDDSYFLIN